MFKTRFILLISLALMCLSSVSVNAAPKPPAPPKFAPPAKGVPPSGSPPKDPPPSRGGPSNRAGGPVNVTPTPKPTTSSRTGSSVQSLFRGKGKGVAEPLVKPPSPLKPSTSKGCQCYVPAIYSPVCGSDKKIYANKYLLECENTCSNKKLKIVRDGKC